MYTSVLFACVSALPAVPAAQRGQKRVTDSQLWAALRVLETELEASAGAASTRHLSSPEILVDNFRSYSFLNVNHQIQDGSESMNGFTLLT